MGRADPLAPYSYDWIDNAVMSCVLVPPASSTRLLLKIVADQHRWFTPLLAVGDWPMARRQLLNLKARAEAGIPRRIG